MEHCYWHLPVNKSAKFVCLYVCKITYLMQSLSKFKGWKVVKPPPSANKEDDKSISSYGYDGKRPAKNPEPGFHLGVFEWLYSGENTEDNFRWWTDRRPVVEVPWLRNIFIDTCHEPVNRSAKFMTVASPPAYTRSHAHRSILSVWFTTPSISKTRYCQVPLRVRQTSRNKTFRYLRGEKTPVICYGF